MPIIPPSLAPADDSDHQLAATLAEQAGELLVDLRLEWVARQPVEEQPGLDDAISMREQGAGAVDSMDPGDGRDPSSDAASTRRASADQLKADGDRRSHELLMSRLQPKVTEGDAVLSEEGIDDARRLSAERVWIVDPLDGTREFGEPPRTDWAVHVALTVDGRPAAGAVALPALGLVLSTAQPPPPPPPMPFRPRIVVSRTRAPAVATHLAATMGGELIEMGSAGAKAMAVVRGDADIYVHAGGQYEWDSCAPVAVAISAGVHCSRLDGSELLYNRADSYLPDLLICRSELAEQALDALHSFGD